MAHNIAFDTAFLERENRTTGPAWHKLGLIVPSDERLKVMEAAVRIGLDQMTVSKTPAVGFYEMPDGEQHLVVTDSVLLVRAPMRDKDPQPRYFGHVSADYGLIQHTDLAEMLDAVSITDSFPLETIGALGYGERVFITFKAGGSSITAPGSRKRDDITSYFLVTNSSDGLRAAQAGFSAVRAVCENTLTAALAALQAGVKLTHTPNVQADLKLMIKMLTGLQSARENALGIFQGLADYRASDDEVRAVIKAAFPERTVRPGSKASLYQQVLGQIQGDRSLARATEATFSDALDKETVQRMLADRDAAEKAQTSENERAQAMQAFTWDRYVVERDEFPDHGGLWLGWNAVAEVSDWLLPQRMSEERFAIATLLEGDRLDAKTRGLRKAVELAGMGNLK